MSPKPGGTTRVPAGKVRETRTASMSTPRHHPPEHREGWRQGRQMVAARAGSLVRKSWQRKKEGGTAKREPPIPAGGVPTQKHANGEEIGTDQRPYKQHEDDACRWREVPQHKESAKDNKSENRRDHEEIDRPGGAQENGNLVIALVSTRRNAAPSRKNGHRMRPKPVPPRTSRMESNSRPAIQRR